MHKNSLTIGLLALVGLVSPSGVQSAEAPAANVDVDMMAREYKETVNGPGALTRKMIESCVILKIEMERDNDKLDHLRKHLQDLHNEVKDLGAYLKNNKGQFDENDTSAARAEYDAKVKMYNSRIPILKKKTRAYQDMIKPYKEKEGKFEQECNNQPYYEDDYNAIEKKLGRGL